jgi:hypothetical protein
MAQWGAETYVGFYYNILKNYSFLKYKFIQLVFLYSEYVNYLGYVTVLWNVEACNSSISLRKDVTLIITDVIFT